LKLKKQDNGIWGSPYNLKSSDFFVMKSDKNYLIHSAICQAISQVYDRFFDIFLSDENGFKINIDGHGTSSIKYSLFEVDDDILYVFKDDNEHNIFLRKNKLKKIYEYR
jgi:hypothetical protein